MNKNFLTPQEINEKLLNKIPDPYIRDKAIIEILYKTGLRVKELINLKKEDLDLNSKDSVISINITGNHERTVFIDEQTLILINLNLSHRKKESDYLFISRTGKKLNRADIENIIKKYRVNDTITANTLKQSHINFMLNYNDFTAEEVKKLVGQDYLGIEKLNNEISNIELKNKYKRVDWGIKV